MAYPHKWSSIGYTGRAQDRESLLAKDRRYTAVPHKLAYRDSRINVRANSFPVRVIALWNRLPEYVVMTSRLTTFKRLLRTVNMSYAILGKS